MNRLKATFALFFCSLALPAQQTNLLLVGQGAPVSTAGTTVTVHEGGTAISVGNDDTENALSIYADPIATPSTMTNPSWGNCHVWLDSPDSATPNSGCALYSSSGGPATLLCSAFSSTTAVAGWNTYTLTGCGTPASSTTYFIAGVQASNLVTQGRSNGNSAPTTCPGFTYGEIFANSPLGSFTSNASWPSTFPANDYPGGSGCYGVYIDLNYTTTAPYTVVSQGACTGFTGNASPQTCAIPPTASGSTLVAFLGTYQESTAGTVSMKDSAGSVLTMEGTCSQASNAGITGNDLWVPACAFWESNTVSGLTSVNANFTGSSAHDVIAVQEITGTAASSFDTYAPDTSGKNTPFAGANLVTSHADFASCFVVNSNLVDTGSPGAYTPTGSWTQVTYGTSAGSGGATAYTFSLFDQAFPSSGAKNCTGTYSVSGATNYSMTMGFHN